MDQTVAKTAPYFDLDALRERDLGACRALMPGRIPRCATALVERLRQPRRRARRPKRGASSSATATAGPAPKACRAFQDALIRLTYDFTTNHVYRAKNPSAAERMAVVAQAAMAAGMLAPGSDIDLLFLLPYKQTAWGESVAEYMLYMLWDLGFKVGPRHPHHRSMRPPVAAPT